MISIIIPAHNEESTIISALSEYYGYTIDGTLEVIVVCNGCSDKTVDKVKNFGDAFICIETPIPSKANALNLGDAVAKGYTRVYQDADVVIKRETILNLADALENKGYMAAAPRMKMNLQNSSWAVRSYYQIWLRMPYVREGMIGVGVYALSNEGRKKFDKFPIIISDDGFVRALFKKNERITINEEFSNVRAPRHLKGLLKIKTRSRLGKYELFTLYPYLRFNEEKDYLNAWRNLIFKFKLWPAILVYIYVNIYAMYNAIKLFKRGNFSGTWERDNSSRSVDVEVL